NTFNITERKVNKNLSIIAAIRMALLNMKEKLSRNILIALGGSIGIMSVILMLGLGNGVNGYLTDTMNENVNPMISEARMTKDTQDGEDSGPDGESSDGRPGNLVANNPAVQLSENIPFEASNIEELRDIPNVRAIELAYTSFSI